MSAVLPGTHLSCKTTLGAVIKGNVIATDENFGTLVISKHGFCRV